MEILSLTRLHTMPGKLSLEDAVENKLCAQDCTIAYFIRIEEQAVAISTVSIIPHVVKPSPQEIPEIPA